MDEDALSRIIEAEKEIQKRLEDETRMAAERLKKLKRETGDRVMAEEARLKEAAEETVLKARSEAEAEALAIAGRAAKEAERLGRIKGNELRGMVRRRIAMILPDENS